MSRVVRRPPEPQRPTDGALLDVRQAAARLHVSTFAVRKWVREQRLSVTRLGRTLRFRPDVIEEFIEQNTRVRDRREAL